MLKGDSCMAEQAQKRNDTEMKFPRWPYLGDDANQRFMDIACHVFGVAAVGRRGKNNELQSQLSFV